MHLPYCNSPWTPSRWQTRPVPIGPIAVGGNNPIRLQSMLTTDTMDTDACVAETLRLVEAGCEIVRITAPTVRDAANLNNIRQRLRQLNCHVPLVADIHFKPAAALEAALHVEKVRINPGNYADKKKFVIREYTDEQYAAELQRVRQEFLPLLQLLKKRKIALRIGTNHGSLSDRILNRFGDTPLGMVESALEFARFAREENYHDFVFSMKASNPKVMIAAYRLLAAHLRKLGPDWNYPLHLGVTEAGDGSDGRIKSAVGIGSLLLDGLGDTIRISLTEPPENEIPVAQALLKVVEEENSHKLQLDSPPPLPFDPFSYSRRQSALVQIGNLPIGGSNPPRVAIPKSHSHLQYLNNGQIIPEFIYENAPLVHLDPRDESAIEKINASTENHLVTIADGLPLPVVPAFRLLAARLHPRHPILLKDTLDIQKIPPPGTSLSEAEELHALLRASVNLGSLLCDGIGDAVLVRSQPDPHKALELAYNILQATGTRIFKTDFVACPSCGRTLFDLQSTTARIRAATGHLSGLRIAVMGCIVNGPGEMADADFGYVGGAPGKINLYVGKTPVRFNIPEEKAVEELIALIREHGKWQDPP